MKKVKEHVIYYFNSYWLSLTSIAYGWQLVRYPAILQTYKVYQRIRDVFDHRLIGLIFIALGLLYALSTALDWRKVRRLTLPVFSFIWSFFGMSFVLSEPPNTVGILTLCVALMGFGVSLRGDFKDG